MKCRLLILPFVLGCSIASVSSLVHAEISATKLDELKVKAEQQDPNALSELGRRYEVGDGVVRL